MRRQTITHTFVEYIPEQLDPGVLYISRRYATASHLCCCGCGLEVVTPLNPAKWRLVDRDGTVSLFPSIGNWSFPCQSHYWIDGGRVRWAAAMSAAQIARVQARDRADVLEAARAPVTDVQRAPSRSRLVGWMTAAVARVRNWLGL
jgi:hypothetical protein